MSLELSSRNVKSRHDLLQKWHAVAYCGDMSRTDATREIADQTNYEIGENVTTLRRRRKMTIKQVGALIGVGESAASYKLSGSNPWQAHEVRIIADYFGVRVGVLYGDEELPRPTAPAHVTRLDPTRNANSRLPDYESDSSAAVVDLSSWRGTRREKAGA